MGMQNKLRNSIISLRNTVKLATSFIHDSEDIVDVQVDEVLEIILKKSVTAMRKAVEKDKIATHLIRNSGGTSAFIRQQCENAEKYMMVIKGKVKKLVTSMISKSEIKSLKLPTTLIRGSQDGKVRDAGTTLTAKAQCVQMMHNETLFTFQVIDALIPKDIFWDNVGLGYSFRLSIVCS